MPFNPIDDPIDYILLANRKSPGIADVTGAAGSRRIDIRKGFALSGARAVFKGIELAEFKVTLKLVSREDWQAWHDWKSLVQRPPAGVRARAQDIWHPILEDLQITQALLKKEAQPVQVDDGVWTIELGFVEYRRPVRVVEVTEGSEETPAPLTQNQRAIVQLTGQLQARSQTLADIS